MIVLETLFEQHNATMHVTSQDGHTVLLKCEGSGFYSMQVQFDGQVCSHVPLGYDYDVAIKNYLKEVERYSI